MTLLTRADVRAPLPIPRLLWQHRCIRFGSHESHPRSNSRSWNKRGVLLVRVSSKHSVYELTYGDQDSSFVFAHSFITVPYSALTRVASYQVSDDNIRNAVHERRIGEPEFT